VRLSDVVTLPAEGLDKSMQHIALERLHQKYVHFVICETKTFEIIGVINLTSSGQKKLEQHIQDRFIEMVLKKTHIPILSLPIQKKYNILVLRKILNKHFQLNLPIKHNYPVKK